LAATSMRSRPILRGSLILRQLLCEQLPAPPPGAQGSAGVPEQTAGAREWTESVTGEGSCAGCHSLLNPLGFALEGYDSLGRERSEESLYDARGALLVSRPVDTAATVQIGELGGAVNGPHDVAAMILDSGKLGECLATEYFRYANGRAVEPETADVALVEHLAATLEVGEISRFFMEITQHPTFRVRGWEAP
jgi:Protein of unknown function (DUF1588)